MAGTKRPMTIISTDRTLTASLKALLKDGDVVVDGPLDPSITADAYIGPNCLMSNEGTLDLTARVIEHWRTKKPLPAPKQKAKKVSGPSLSEIAASVPVVGVPIEEENTTSATDETDKDSD